MSNRQFHLEWRDADNSFTRDTFDSVKTILDKLVELGELRRSDSRYSAVYFLPDKKVVRARYQKEGGEWAWGVICSQHGRIDRTNDPGKWREHYGQHVHFVREHPNDTVEWDDPPKKASIIYEAASSGTNVRAYCYDHGYSTFYSEDHLKAWVDNHVKFYHPNDDVFFGEVPKPPHKHHWVWGVEQYGPSQLLQRTVIRCQSYDCGVRFYHPEGLINQDYTGPVPDEFK